MNPQSPTFSVQMDATNPGQFFACCGLLELAHRLWPGAEGCFEDDSFLVMCSEQRASAHTIVAELVSAEWQKKQAVREIRGSDNKPANLDAVLPIRIGGKFGITIGWWIDEIEGRFSSLKLWAGRQKSWQVFGDVYEAAKKSVKPNGELFEASVPLKSRFGVDPRASWESLNMGFSPNTTKLPVATFAIVELLATVGLVGFRPAESDGRFLYSTWIEPLPVNVARAAASGTLGLPGSRSFTFSLVERGSFKAFTQSIPTEEQ